MRLRRLLHSPGKYKHYLLSFLIQLALAGFLIHEWDGVVLITSAKQFLQGVTPYQTALQAPPYTFGTWLQMWYAYPPLPLLMFSATYAPCFYFLGENLILERIFIKLSFILGNLLCAYLVYRFVAEVSSKENASRAEKLVLYNPFLIYIAAAWGMFDIWMVNFMLLSLLYLRQDKLGKAGICYGLSLLVKPIPVIFGPVLLAYIWNKKGGILKPAIFGSWAVAAFSIVSLPFFLTCPQGFVNQVIGMHAARAPFGLSPLHFFYGEALEATRHISFPGLSSSVITAISIALLFISISIIFLYCYLKKEWEEKGLLVLLFLITLTFTIFSKGVSPQHYVIPVVLAVVILYTYEHYSIIKLADIRRYYWFLGIPLLLGGAILAGRHYLSFIPPDIALKLFGKTASKLDSQIASNFPISADFYYSLVQAFAELLTLLVVVMAVIILYKSLRQIIPATSKLVSTYLIRARQIMWGKAIEKPLTAFMASLFLVLPTLAGVISSQATAREGYVPPPHSFDRGDKLVGAFYYYWDNSSNDPTIQCDDWLKAGLTPKEGYYNSISAYMSQDIQQMKGDGIGFALLSFNNNRLERYISFIIASEEANFYAAPVIELQDLEEEDACLATSPTGKPFAEEPLSLTNETKREIIQMINSALRMKDSPAFLMYGKKPVIFLRGCFDFYPGWSKEEMNYLARSVLELYQNEYKCSRGVALEKISANWGKNVTSMEDMVDYFFPKSTKAFYNPQNRIEEDWCQGFEYGWQQFWKEIQLEVEHKQGDIFWISDSSGWWQPEVTRETIDTSFQLFDAAFLSSPSFAWDYARDDTNALAYWESQIGLLCNCAEEHDSIIIATTMPYYNDLKVRPKTGIEIPLIIKGQPSYDLFWKIALDNEPDLVLIASWNNYYESSCIEPTLEFGKRFLDRTEYWVSMFKTPAY